MKGGKHYGQINSTAVYVGNSLTVPDPLFSASQIVPEKNKGTFLLNNKIKMLGKLLRMLENGNRLTQIFLPLQINGKQFPVEAYYQRHICHPNIIQLLDVFTHKENFVYVLERPEDSSDLFDIMDVDDGMTEDDGRRFFTQILDATIQCEEQGILHRDIKPENIIVDLTNMDAKLTDFGLACETQEEPFRRFVGKSWEKNRPVCSLFNIYCLCHLLARLIQARSID